MAPPHQVRLSSPSPLSLSTEHRRRRCSTAQMCFFNILRIISDFSAVDSPDEKCLSRDEAICESRGLDVDLNIGLRPPAEIETADGGDGSENCVLEKNDPSRGESLESAIAEQSEISHVGDQSSGIDYNGASEAVVEEEKPRDEGYLGLLIEAAQLILGENESEHLHEPPVSKYVETTVAAAARGGVKRKQQWWTAAAEAEWYAEFEDTSPVVKSKRGRNQVLPYKYRDSVVEPLVQWPPARHRSPVPSKRRSK